MSDKIRVVKENGKFHAYSHHAGIELAFSEGETKEECFLNLAEALAIKLAGIHMVFSYRTTNKYADKIESLRKEIKKLCNDWYLAGKDDQDPAVLLGEDTLAITGIVGCSLSPNKILRLLETSIRTFEKANEK